MASASLPVVGQIAERHPGVRLIVDHLGRTRGAQDEAGWANLPDLLALAKHPNVAIKATGAPSYSSQPYPFSNIHDYLAPDLRRLWPGSHVLGHRHHPYALFLATMRHHVH